MYIVYLFTLCAATSRALAVARASPVVAPFAKPFINSFATNLDVVRCERRACFELKRNRLDKKELE